MKTHSESDSSAVIDNVTTTVECCYEGSPVPFSQVLEYAQCSPDDITRAVRAGRVKVVRKLVRDGRLLKGPESLFLVPEWAEIVE
jgi:hypothetical protein